MTLSKRTARIVVGRVRHRLRGRIEEDFQPTEGSYHAVSAPDAMLDEQTGGE